MSDMIQNGAGEAEQTSAIRRAHIIVTGNEKGGSGKTTTTMHLIVALLRLGFSVGSMDIDSRQRSLSRYVENRRDTVAKEGIPLPVPHHVVIQKSPFATEEDIRRDERDRFAKGLASIYGRCDFVIIDTPGNDTYLSRLAHSFADTVITPINDSFVDLDVLAMVDGRTMQIVRPSIYSEMVWEQKLSRAKRDGASIDWIVMRNRLSNIDARNKRFMTQVTEELARRIGFRLAPGFSERVIFREMFLQGLTVLDVVDEALSMNVSMSHVAARQEVRDLLKVLNIPKIDQRIRELRDGKEEAPEEKLKDKSEDKKEPVTAAPIAAREPVSVEALKPILAKQVEAVTVVVPDVQETVLATPQEAHAASLPTSVVVSMPEKLSEPKEPETKAVEPLRDPRDAVAVAAAVAAAANAPKPTEASPFGGVNRGPVLFAPKRVELTEAAS